MANIAMDVQGSIYHGIKKLWNSEVSTWKQATMREYYLYAVPNSVYNELEHWLVETPGDLATLREYLKERGRTKDFDKIEKID